MYVLLVLILLLALIGGLYFVLSWSLAETPEDLDHERTRNPRSFYDPRTWAAYHRLVAQKPPLLSSRRDRQGRFRKMR
jgi:hypothetical protein